MRIKYAISVHLFMVFSFLAFTSGAIVAGEQSGEDARLLNMSIDQYKARVSDERKILEGLKKLFELEQRKALSDEGVTTEMVAMNEDLYIEKKTGNYDTVFFSIKADLVSMDEILQTLVSASGKKIIIDEDIDKEELSSVISIHLENTPLVDIIDIILGAKGLETIISENLIFVTLPAKLHVASSYGYYQEKAIQAYQKAMIKYPSYDGIVRAYHELGNFYLASGFPSIALQEHMEVIANYPDHPLARRSLFNAGKSYEMLDDIENAKKLYLKYVQKYPQATDVDDTYLIIGDLWRRQGNYEKAAEVYHYIIKEYHDRDTVMFAHMRLGYVYIDSKDYASALKTFLNMKKVFQSGRREFGSPGNNVLMANGLILPDELRYALGYQIGNCYYLLREYDKAIWELSKFVFHEQDNDMLDDAYYKLADCFFKKEDYLTAFQLYKSALSELPDSSLSPHGFLYSGKSLRRIKMLDSAIEILNQGLSRHQDGIYAENMKFEIGLCYLDDENYKRALDTFEKIVKRKRNKDLTVKADIYAGVCLERDKQFEKAIERYQEALAFGGEGDLTEKQKNWVFRLIGDSYSELGLLSKAIKAYQQDI